MNSEPSKPRSLRPYRNWSRAQWIGQKLLKSSGWKIKGEVPDVSHCVAIVAPHTSNWDFIWGTFAMLASDLEITWIAKHTLFRWPVGWVMRKLGGMPIHRKATQGFVAASAEKLKTKKKAFLCIAPEGTRSRNPHWKTGFWYIAKKANIPIWIVRFDYHDKSIIFGPTLLPTNIQDDFEAIRSFYQKSSPKREKKWVLPVIPNPS